MKLILFILLLCFGCSQNKYLPRAKKLTSKDGYLLVVPSERTDKGLEKERTAKLIDKKGNVVKSWSFNFIPASAKLDDKGNLYISGSNKTINDQEKIAHGMNSYFEKRNRNGEVVWKYENKLRHHDFKVLPNGNILFIEYYPIDPKKYNIQREGNQFIKGRVWPDRIIEVEPSSNKIVWSWDSHKYINLSKNKLTDKKGNLLHCNSVNYIEKYYQTQKPAIIISCRIPSTVYIIDKESKKILWESPKGLFFKQHDATFVDDHTILVFNNGRLNSNVIEYDLKTSKKVWEYSGGGNLYEMVSFFSSVISGAQRRKNGNTVITLGTRGYVLEVDRDKKVVWNYLNIEDEQDMSVGWPYHSIFKARMYEKY